MSRDEIFRNKRDVTPFEFNEEVAHVFDDMLERSIPFYSEIHQLILDVIAKKMKNGSTIYDLGCSTGTTIKLISDKFSKHHFKYIGIDRSFPMIEKSKSKLNGLDHLVLKCEDFTQVEFVKCDLVIMNYTLQFVDKEKRQNLLSKIYKSLNHGGILVMAEKINCDNEQLHPLFTELYYDFKKRNGYSELEISQKREALENVLMPLTPNEQISLLVNSGFECVEMPFRWYNFATFIGLKNV